LARFQRGDATFVYLSDIDLQCHMLWRHGDPKHADAPAHPAHDPASAEAHRFDIEGYYQHVDGLLGRVVDRLPPETLLLVMSDHGFQPFTRVVHLNSWLRDEGFLVLKDGKRTGHIAAGDVDWSKTKAYALGFNSVYLNVAGREAQGIVPAGEAAAVADDLRTRLLAFKDAQSGRAPVLRVDRAKDLYHGDRVGEAPDLVVGYDSGYGHSDESTLGEVLEVVLADNTSRWSGNHLMAPEVVPGVLLANRAVNAGDHDLTDVTATILAWYGLDLLPGMQGSPFLNP
jgi:predicted AlkP superfamily phosphohydrolase/phosphomutase